MKVRYLLAKASALLFVFCLFAMTATAKIGVPVNFSGSVTTNSSGQQIASLHWAPNSEGTAPLKYLIYMATGEKTTYDGFTNVGSVAYKQGTTEYSWNSDALNPGTYSFYILATGYDQNVEVKSPNTKIVVLKIENRTTPNFEVPPSFEFTAYINKLNTFQVYAKSNMDCPITWSGDVPAGIKLDPKTGIITWTPDKAGITVTFTLKATIECKETGFIMTKMTKVTITTKNSETQSWVKITSQPPTTGTVGTKLTYAVKAETNVNTANCLIRFALVNPPDGATINAETGVITWTPMKAGLFTFSVKAYLSCNEKVYAIQEIKIEVAGGVIDDKPCAVIKGVISFNDGTKTILAKVTAWRVDNNSATPSYSVSTQTGEFQINVPAGTYILRFEGENFKPFWYEHAQELKEAKRITVKCQDIYKVTVVVEKKTQPKTFTVCGKVVAAADGAPIYAMVEFIPVKYIYMPAQNSNYPKYQAKTDDKGNYCIQLPDGDAYIAHAINMMSSKNYEDQYYYKVNTPDEAKIIAHEMKEVNFYLHLRDGKIELCGSVVNGDNKPIQSFVIAILIKSTKQDYNIKEPFTKMAEANADGKFCFNNLPEGGYLFLSIPADRKYIPGYFKAGEFVTQNWKEATIFYPGNMSPLGLVMKHKVRPGERGIIKAKGLVKENKGMADKGDKPNDIVPIAGAFVYAANDAGNIVDFGISDGDGNFELGELLPGTYTLYADKAGYDLSVSTFTADYEDNSAPVKDITMQPENTSDVTEPVININMNIMPMPIDNEATLNFTATGSTTKIIISDILGNTLVSEQINTVFGNNSYRINGSALPTGVYTLTVEMDKTIKTMRLYVAH